MAADSQQRMGRKFSVVGKEKTDLTLEFRLCAEGCSKFFLFVYMLFKILLLRDKPEVCGHGEVL